MDFTEILKTVLTSVLSIIVLFIIAKVLGHKQISQLDFFDYITGITVGSIAAELATELEKPMQPLTAMIVYGIIAFALSIITGKFPKARKFINGTPTILMHNGKIYRKNMKKAKINLSDFMVMCREQGFFNLSDIKTAIFEFNGKLAILPISTKRPINPLDINIVPEPEEFFTELIMDGHILKSNLKRMGFDIKWLENELKIQGYKTEKNIALAVCDSKNNLTVFSQA